MMDEGIISKSIAGFYHVVNEQGELLVCKSRGIFRKDDIVPLVGDKVLVEYKDKMYVISKILERKNELIRPPVANVDICVIVVASVVPEISLIFLDKLLVSVQKENIVPIICVNKIDLDSKKTYLELKNQYRCFLVLGISAKTGEGMEELKHNLLNKISVFAGQSGVGKSSILNRLIPNAFLKVGDISKKIERGKNTTRVVELLRLDNNTFVADTPGFSSFDLREIKRSDLKNYYPEFANSISCKYPNCDHISEPECAVKMAVSKDEISYERYERYKNIYIQLPIEKIYK